MNINNWSTNKKVLAVLIILLMIGGIILTIFLVQKQQDARSRATAATVLSLTPETQDASQGDDVPLNIHLNPGSNRVNALTLVIDYDANKFTADASSFKTNPSIPFLSVLEGPVVTSGEIAVTLDTGSDTTKVIDTESVVGTLTLKVKAGATAGASPVKFNTDANKTQVKSTATGDKFDENVLSSTVPASINITGDAPQCVPHVASCSWSASSGASGYHYIITDTSDDSLIQEEDVDAPTTSITFDSEPGVTYKCEVTAKNSCAMSSSAEGTSTCPTPGPSPSPSPELSPSPTTTAKLSCNATCELSSDCTSGFCSIAEGETQGVCRNNACEEESSCACPKITAEPTDTPEVTEAPATEETPIPTEIVQGEVTATPTPVPTLPPTGNPFVMGGIIGGFLFVLGGLALLIL